MSEVDKGFEAAPGWSFRREEDGSVRIIAPDSMGPGAHQNAVLSADAWEATVAAMALEGGVG